MAVIKTTHRYPFPETAAEHIGGADCSCKPIRRTKAVGPRRVNTEVTYVHQALRVPKEA